jgi:hypothetical protein
MKIFIAFILLFVIFLSFPVYGIEARSGCCSHHKGVCGCSCCDGTGLSATCLPYYPECAQRPVKKEIAIPPRKITNPIVHQDNNPPSSTPFFVRNTPTPTDGIASNKNAEDSGASPLILPIMAYGGYWLYKSIKNANA